MAEVHHSLIGDLAIVLVVAAATGLITRRLGQPSVLGYLFAGLIVGPYIPIPLFADPHRMEELAEVGVVLVMLAVGLEFRVQRLLQILPLSGLTAAVQIAALGWAGFTVGSVLGWTTPASITLGSCLAISSTMVVSAVLRTQPVDPDVRSHVFGVLVVQDVVAIVLIAVVTAMAAGQSLGPTSLALLVAQLSAVVVGMLVTGLLVLPRLVRWVLGALDAEALVVLVSAAGFGFALAAESFGYSVALGAFLAGMAIAESGRGHEVEKAMEPLRALLSALFFVSIGMAVDPRVAWSSLPLAALLSVVVIGMQFVSVTGASLLSGISLRRAVFSGLALGQIGELSFILATIAIGGGLVPAETLPALVTVATVTAFTTPFLLKRAEGLVALIDHALPDRANDLLAAYQAFVRRARTSGEGPSLRGPVFAVSLDWVALVILLAVELEVRPRLAEDLHAMVQLTTLLVALPFVVGLWRSGRRLARGVQDVVRGGSTPAVVAPVLEGLALVAVVLAVGAPTVAVLRPLVGRSLVELALVAVLAVSVVVLVRRVGRASEYTSGVARLAAELARHTAEEDPEHPAPEPVVGPLAGLDYVPVALSAEAPAAGRTLAELNVRVKTGATVVAILRPGQTTVLPTGHERLAGGDTLAVSGSKAAVARAVSLLQGPT